jgi:hypothetical protein
MNPTDIIAVVVIAVPDGSPAGDKEMRNLLKRQKRVAVDASPGIVPSPTPVQAVELTEIKRLGRCDDIEVPDPLTGIDQVCRGTAAQRQPMRSATPDKMVAARAVGIQEVKRTITVDMDDRDVRIPGYRVPDIETIAETVETRFALQPDPGTTISGGRRNQRGGEG